MKSPLTRALLCAFAFILPSAAAAQDRDQTFAPNDPGIVYSPYNWHVTAAEAVSVNPGAYFRTLFSGNTASLIFDASRMGSPPTQIWWRIDNFTWQKAEASFLVPLTIPVETQKALRYHSLEVIFKSQNTGNRWDADSTGTALKFKGLTLDLGAKLAAPRASRNSILIYGDSITEGVMVAAVDHTNVTDNSDAQTSWAFLLRELLGVEAGVVGFGSQGYTTNGIGGVPPIPAAFNLIFQGQPRTFDAAPSLIVDNEGANDGGAPADALVAAITAFYADLLRATPARTKIISLGILPSVVNAGVNAAKKAAVQKIHSPRLFYVGTEGIFETRYGALSDNLHPSGPNNQFIIAPQVADLLAPFLSPAEKTAHGANSTAKEPQQ